MIKNKEILKIIDEQKKFFQKGITFNVDYRIKALKELKKAILEFENDLSSALFKDLRKSKFESYATEIGFILDEITFVIKNLKKWVKAKKVKTNLINLPAKSFIYHEPYGTALIISPWNYPFQLLISPLIGAIAAGNTAILKPSEVAAETGRIINRMISRTFKKNFIAVIEGGIETNKLLLDQHLDFIFFTGSVNVGKFVMEKASKFLTPVVLELGGKSPAIIMEDAELDISAKRIVWGKFLNSGQTCIAPDYLLVQKSIKEKFIGLCIKHIKNSFSENPIESSDYVKIINKNHFNRLLSLMKDEKIIFGGKSDPKKNMIEPTILENVKLNSKIMKEEIFGPLLPVMTFEKIDEAIEIVNKNPNPLSMYVFTKNKKIEKLVLKRIKAGGGCINDCVMHISNPNLPFGGISTSGTGRYHGRASFDIFSNQKSILKRPFAIDLPFRYPPYKNKLKFIKMILK
jgi:aldehyde dehydrogenase (NAD+)